jgi:hypothetical protein
VTARWSAKSRYEWLSRGQRAQRSEPRPQFGSSLPWRYLRSWQALVRWYNRRNRHRRGFSQIRPIV